MNAMILERVVSLNRNRNPLRRVDIPRPGIGECEVLVRVSACGVCHTELDQIEGRIHIAKFPVIPGHQVVGMIEEIGNSVDGLSLGDRVGVAWIYSACGTCIYCLQGNENLCAEFRATGCDVHGGYAEYIKVPEKFVHPIPQVFTDAEAAPLLCAGAIGYRSVSLSGIQDHQILGLTGFGASGHLVLKMVKFSFPRTKTFVFARSESEQQFALQLGADWAGDTNEQPPEKIDAIIDTTPVWKPVIAALENLRPGGRLVINAIRKENIDRDSLSAVDYPRHIWLEKEIKSVANVTRADVRGFLDLAAKIPIKPEYEEYDLINANMALLELKNRKIRGAKVLRI